MHLDRINLHRLYKSFVTKDTRQSRGIPHRRILWNATHAVIDSLDDGTFLVEEKRQEAILNLCAAHQCVAGMRLMDVQNWGNNQSAYDWVSLLGDISACYMTHVERQFNEHHSPEFGGRDGACEDPVNAKQVVHNPDPPPPSKEHEASEPQPQPLDPRQQPQPQLQPQLQPQPQPQPQQQQPEVPATSQVPDMGEGAQHHEHDHASGDVLMGDAVQDDSLEVSSEASEKAILVSRRTSRKTSDQSLDKSLLETGTPISPMPFILPKNANKATNERTTVQTGDTIVIKMIGRQRQRVHVMEVVRGISFVLVSYDQYQQHFDEYQPMSRVSMAVS